jgi:hypothetical protein
MIVVFWHVAPCSLLGKYQHFKEAYCLHLQGREENKRNVTDLNAEVPDSSKKAAHIYQTAWHHITAVIFIVTTIRN